MRQMTQSMKATAPDPNPHSLLTTPSDLGPKAATEIARTLNRLLADVFTLYLKTKNFHWHLSGPQFRDYHVMLDEHAQQIHAATDAIAERVRKVGGATLRSIGDISRRRRLRDNDAEYVKPDDMLAELRDDNLQLAAYLRESHGICDEHGDVASSSLLETWIDEAEARVWYLFETAQQTDSSRP